MHFSLDCSISLTELDIVCPTTKAAIEAHEDFISWGSLAEDLENGEAEELLPLVENLKKDFKDKSKLDLHITYIDDLEAGWPNQVGNCLLEVDGVVDLTQEGKDYIAKYRSVADIARLSLAD